MTVRVPRPSSDIVTDPKTGKTSREWFQYLERLGVVASILESLAQGRIWIGDANSIPVQRQISGDATLSASGALTLAYTANFRELAQDAIGVMVDGTIVYVDATPLLTRAALTGAITAAQGSNATALGSFTKAQLDTAVSDGNVLFVGDITQYTDELAQDAVGGILTDTATIDLDYADSTPAITANVRADSIAVSFMHASATDVLFGRSTASSGPGEEIALTAAGRALIAGANAAAQRTTLGIGSGLSVTITTAALTGGGTTGSQTFTNGVLTAQVAAT